MIENLYDMEKINNEERDFLLWRFLNKDVTPEESLSVQKLLDEDNDWKNALQEIQKTEEQFSLLETESPSMRFSKNIMESIAAEPIAKPIKSYINTRLIKAIVYSFVIVIVGILTYTFTQLEWTNTTEKSKPIQLPKVNIDWGFTNVGSWFYLFFAIVIVCIFVLVDRFIQSKRQYRTQE